MTIEIINLRNHEFHNEQWQFRVDRGTPIGIPYYMQNESKCIKVRDEYELYFRKLITYPTLYLHINNNKTEIRRKR